ncbi:class I SAM-dependent methyltransferase [Marinicella meishanensis]|uniref:class I SAM-dependent methyltransferase n=1 Tax=Marinicella meishanensis TaxID=2873263 RepID=UPI001CBD31A1|nr:class I SAM-dependent methyltransferase [Marinicella sp. NBU2979]
MNNFLSQVFKAFRKPEPTPEPDPGYEEKIANEIEFYAECENVHDLPDIFHYWSNKYLLPMQQRFGFNSPDDFFRTQVQSHCAANNNATHHIVSIGSGNGELEVSVAEYLLDNDINNFSIECVDINPHMLERTQQLAAEKGVAEHILVQVSDFNQWQGKRNHYDIVMANQSLHHVMNLEGLFAAIKKSMKQTAIFITSDMIGRNGHQRWPEALDLLQPFWSELPDQYRFNQLLKRHEESYINHDCSDTGFEGIRAQDILPLLVKDFQFELFIPFANIIMVFIDRPFGHNFDATADWDMDFIDRVHAADEQAIMDGTIKPTQMLAVMKKQSVKAPQLRHELLTPEYCIRPVK